MSSSHGLVARQSSDTALCPPICCCCRSVTSQDGFLSVAGSTESFFSVPPSQTSLDNAASPPPSPPRRSYRTSPSAVKTRDGTVYGNDWRDAGRISPTDSDPAETLFKRLGSPPSSILLVPETAAGQWYRQKPEPRSPCPCSSQESTVVQPDPPPRPQKNRRQKPEPCPCSSKESLVLQSDPPPRLQKTSSESVQKAPCDHSTCPTYQEEEPKKEQCRNDTCPKQQRRRRRNDETARDKMKRNEMVIVDIEEEVKVRVTPEESSEGSGPTYVNIQEVIRKKVRVFVRKSSKAAGDGTADREEVEDRKVKKMVCKIMSEDEDVMRQLRMKADNLSGLAERVRQERLAGTIPGDRVKAETKGYQEYIATREKRRSPDEDRDRKKRYKVRDLIPTDEDRVRPTRPSPSYKEPEPEGPTFPCGYRRRGSPPDRPPPPPVVRRRKTPWAPEYSDDIDDDLHVSFKLPEEQIKGTDSPLVKFKLPDEEPPPPPPVQPSDPTKWDQEDDDMWPSDYVAPKMRPRSASGDSTTSAVYPAGRGRPRDDSTSSETAYHIPYSGYSRRYSKLDYDEGAIPGIPISPKFDSIRSTGTDTSKMRSRAGSVASTSSTYEAAAVFDFMNERYPTEEELHAVPMPTVTTLPPGGGRRDSKIDEYQRKDRLQKALRSHFKEYNVEQKKPTITSVMKDERIKTILKEGPECPCDGAPKDTRADVYTPEQVARLLNAITNGRNMMVDTTSKSESPKNDNGRRVPGGTDTYIDPESPKQNTPSKEKAKVEPANVPQPMLLTVVEEGPITSKERVRVEKHAKVVSPRVSPQISQIKTYMPNKTEPKKNDSKSASPRSSILNQIATSWNSLDKFLGAGKTKLKDSLKRLGSSEALKAAGQERKGSIKTDQMTKKSSSSGSDSSVDRSKTKVPRSPIGKEIKPKLKERFMTGSSDSLVGKEKKKKTSPREDEKKRKGSITADSSSERKDPSKRKGIDIKTRLQKRGSSDSLIGKKTKRKGSSSGESSSEKIPSSPSRQAKKKTSKKALVKKDSSVILAPKKATFSTFGRNPSLSPRFSDESRRQSIKKEDRPKQLSKPKKEEKMREPKKGDDRKNHVKYVVQVEDLPSREEVANGVAEPPVQKVIVPNRRGLMDQPKAMPAADGKKKIQGKIRHMSITVSPKDKVKK